MAVTLNTANIAILSGLLEAFHSRAVTEFSGQISYATYPDRRDIEPKMCCAVDIETDLAGQQGRNSMLI